MSITLRLFAAAFVASMVLGCPARAEEPAGAAPPVQSAPVFPKRETRLWQMGLTRSDRLQHATFSYSAGLMIGLTSEAPIAAATGAIGFGIAKELWDMRRSRFDTLDLLADALGAAGAYATTVTLTR